MPCKVKKKTEEILRVFKSVVIFFFPYNPPPPLPRQTPRPSQPEELDFGPFRLRLAPFRLRLAPFRVCFGSVSGPFRGVGWGREEGLL